MLVRRRAFPDGQEMTAAAHPVGTKSRTNLRLPGKCEAIDAKPFTIRVSADARSSQQKKANWRRDESRRGTHECVRHLKFVHVLAAGDGDVATHSAGFDAEDIAAANGAQAHVE